MNKAEEDYDLFVICEDLEETKAAAQAIANYRYWKKCKCDHDVGYICEHCHKHGQMLDDEGERFYRFQERYQRLIYRSRVRQ